VVFSRLIFSLSAAALAKAGFVLSVACPDSIGASRQKKGHPQNSGYPYYPLLKANQFGMPVNGKPLGLPSPFGEGAGVRLLTYIIIIVSLLIDLHAMKNPPRHLSNWELSYHINKDHLPTDFRDTMDTLLEFCNFYTNIYEACNHRLTPELNKLMLRHYPATQQATHPAQLDYIQDLHETNIFGLLLTLRNRLREQREGINTREKYPKLDSWKEFYCTPSQPDTVNDKHRNIYVDTDDAEWEKYKQEENRKFKMLHEWQQSRQTEYYDLVQPYLFEYFPDLHNLEPDFWILYAVTVRDNYEEWLTSCEYLETAIEYHLPPDSITWDYPDFKQCLRKQRPHYFNQVQENRNKMIFG
jgi:hypothetical protein